MGLPARNCNFNGSVAPSVVAGCADVSRSVTIDVTELVRTVFSALSALVIDDVEDAGDVICVRARTRAGAVACPGCGAETARVHEYRERAAADVPVDGRRVLVRVRVRRMRCPALDCKVQTFREQVPGVLDRYQRRVSRLTAQVSTVARELAGRASARLLPAASRNGCSASRSTGPPSSTPTATTSASAGPKNPASRSSTCCARSATAATRAAPTSSSATSTRAAWTVTARTCHPAGPPGSCSPGRIASPPASKRCSSASKAPARR